jgi:TPR repeat protein
VKQGKKMQDIYFFQCQVERLQQQQQMQDNKWGFKDLPIGHFESCLQAN